jgi:hypothetical protein
MTSGLAAMPGRPRAAARERRGEFQPCAVNSERYRCPPRPGFTGSWQVLDRFPECVGQCSAPAMGGGRQVGGGRHAATASVRGVSALLSCLEGR